MGCILFLVADIEMAADEAVKPSKEYAQELFNLKKLLSKADSHYLPLMREI